MLLYPLLSILWAGSAIAKNSPMVPGWAINEQLMKNGHYVFTTVLEHQKTETSMEPNIRDDRLVTLAKTAYEDLDKVISNYDGFSWYKKPTLVAALQKNSKIYIASTIMRDSSHGVWNPAKAIPSALRRAIYQCQVVILPGVGDHSPSNCAEAMALYLYFAENKSTKESDDRMSDATLAVWGKLEGKTGQQEPCHSVYDENDPTVFANSLGCKPMTKKIGVHLVHKSTGYSPQDKDNILAEIEAKAVCV